MKSRFKQFINPPKILLFFSPAMLICLLAPQFCGAQTAYIPNGGSNNVFVINVATNTVMDTIAVGVNPTGVSVSSDGSKVYVANCDSIGTVSVISTATNTVSAIIPVGSLPTFLDISPDGSKVYVANDFDNTVSVISTASDTVIATIPVGSNPWGVVVTPDGSKVYVVNDNEISNSVSVISTATNTVIATIQVDVPNTIGNPIGIAVSPDGSKVYVTSEGTDKVSVISTATNTVSATIQVGSVPTGISVSPDGSKIYVANATANTLNVINSASNTVVSTIPIGNNPDGVSVTPDGSKVYVVNQLSGTVSVISTATNTVSNTITVGLYPVSIGNFINGTTPNPIANFQTSIDTVCANKCINFTNLSTNATSWQWTFAGASDSTSAAQSPQSICYPAAGNYNVTLIASNSAGSDTVTYSNYITVNPAPPVPVVIQHQDTLFCSTNPLYTSYQWYLDSAVINGATDTSILIIQPGNYNVQVSNSSGCSIAVGINTVLGIQNYSSGKLISLYPNPAGSELKINNGGLRIGKIQIYNVLGETMLPTSLSLGEGRGEAIINVSSLSPGMYFLQAVGENGNWIEKFVKE